MYIKYLKDAPLGKAGETADVADDQAKILITLGYAEEHKAKPKAEKSNDNPEPTDLLTPATNTDSE